MLDALENGHGSEADLEKLLDICDNILGRSFCAFGDGAISPIVSSIKYFRDEYVEHVDARLRARLTRLASTAFSESWRTTMSVQRRPSPDSPE